MLWGDCDALITPEPLGPFWDMAVDHDRISEALRRGSAVRVFHSLVETIEESDGPTLMVIEDLHNGDTATFDVVRMFARRVSNLPVAVAVTLREEGPADDPLWDLVGELSARDAYSVVLQPLSRSAVAEMAGPERHERVWKLAGGNPFLVTEMMDRDSDVTPISVQDAVRARLGRLGPIGRRLVEFVSVVPGRAAVDFVISADPELAKGIEDTEGAGLLTVERAYFVFRHELVKVAVLETLSGSRRRELHADGLAAADDLGLDVATRAHYARGAGDVDAMLRLLPMAADEAERLGGDREAVDHLRAMSTISPHLDPADRAAFYERWATMELAVSGDGREEANRAVDFCRTLGEPTMLVRALLLASRAESYSSESERAESLADEAAALAGNLDSSTKALVLAEQSRLAMMRWQYTRSIALAEEALGLAEPDSPARANALTNIGVCRAIQRYPEGLEDLEQSAQLSRHHGHRLEWYRALENLIGVMTEWHDVRRCRRVIDSLVMDDELVSLQRSMQVKLIHLDLVCGRFEAANQAARQLLGSPNLHAVDRLALTNIVTKTAVLLGAHDAPSWLEVSRTLTEANGELQHTANAVRAEAYRQLYLPNHDQHRIDECLAVLREIADTDGNGPWVTASFALPLWLGGHLPTLPDGSAEPFRWMTDGRWRESADWFDDHGAPFEAAIALSLGDVEARREAIRALDRLGARPHAAMLRRQLRAQGVDRIPGPSRRTTDSAGLTKRQQEVRDLLRDGRTNADIADTLYISVRTVEKHVAAVVQRLGFTDRHDLVETEK